MPKIRCRGCEAVLNVPEEARGKTISCKKCGEKIKVPIGEGAGAKPAKKKPAAKSGPADDLFANLDLDEFESDEETPEICPYCAAPMDEEDPVCRKCGMNVETGQMDAREKRKRAIKGVDPAKFYGAVWGEAWEFVKTEWMLGLKSGISWAIYTTLFFMCSYLGFIWIEAGPPKAFWIGMSVVSFMGIPGWYFWLGIKIIESSIMKSEFRSDRLNSDFFQASAAGFRAVFWPFIVMGPLTPLAVIAYFALGWDYQDPNIQLGAVLLWVPIPLLILPIALVHMSSRYSYKAWILWELIKVAVKNMGALLYFFVVALVAVIPVAILAGPIFGLVVQDWNPMNSVRIQDATGNLIQQVLGETDENSGTYYLVKGPLNVLATGLLVTPICLIAGYCGLFLMKANASFARYNNNYLELVQQMPQGKTATFWVRYLARTVDVLVLPLTLFLVSANPKANMIGWVITGMAGLVYFTQPAIFWPFMGGWLLYMSWLYWVVQESSELKSTFGKDAFGLMVVPDVGDKPMTMQQANLKWLVRLTSFVLLGLPDLIAAFRPDKKTLGDQVTNTKVVWRGDR